MKKLLANPINFLYIAIFLAVVFIIVRYGLKNWKKSDEQKLINNINSEIDKSNLSFSDGQFSVLADRLDTAMRGLGTDEQTIYQIIGSLQTPDDWRKLIVSFGERSYGNSFVTYSGTLLNWLDTELDSSEKQKISQILAKINVIY